MRAMDMAIVEIAQGRVERPFEQNEVFDAGQVDLLNRILSLKRIGCFPEAFEEVGL